jgi:flagellar hook-associated protein 2
MTVFNDSVKYLSAQQTAANSGDKNNIGRDPLVRSLRRDLTSALTASNTVGGGAFSSIAQIGFSISRSGELTLDEATFAAALKSDPASVQKLFYGTDGTNGVFGSFESAIKRFTDAGGLLPSAQKRLDDEATKVANRIADMEIRLETKRAALQKQFIAADQAIAQLNQQGSSLSQLTSSL